MHSQESPLPSRRESSATAPLLGRVPSRDLSNSVNAVNAAQVGAFKAMVTNKTKAIIWGMQTRAVQVIQNLMIL